MRSCMRRLLGPKRAKSTPISAVGVIKQRIARPGEGKSKGYRVIVFLRRRAKAFFVYGFAKSQRASITDDEEEQFKEAAKIVLSLTESALAARLKRGDFVEAESE